MKRIVVILLRGITLAASLLSSRYVLGIARPRDDIALVRQAYYAVEDWCYDRQEAAYIIFRTAYVRLRYLSGVTQSRLERLRTAYRNGGYAEDVSTTTD